LFEGVKKINSIKDKKEHLNHKDLKKLKSVFHIFVVDILGLTPQKRAEDDNFTNEVMELVLKIRRKAKSNKNFATADLIRDELKKLNIQIKDSREGSTWEVKE